ncbi:MAG TPA: hypothetical protein VE959_34820 [Bryobacteraceae bacterium]|nr:hypothetical protein [Bryobacteraceae bacterium]
MLVQVSLGLLTVVVVASLGRLAWAWNKYRGRRVITCPENQRPAGVMVNAAHAAATALGKAPELRLSTCSRWPGRQGCGQECLSQIQASPEDCLVRNILLNWYRGKVCASCGHPFADIEWSHKPALLTAGKVSLEWNQVSADKLFEVLAASQPLCFACHMANTLVREHPDLAVDRSARPDLS